jgi:hypothetical protein
MNHYSNKVGSSWDLGLSIAEVSKNKLIANGSSFPDPEVLEQ